MTRYDTLSALLDERYSCRAFRPDPVPRQDIERILDAARQVPSWCNAQPWQISVTSVAATDRFRTALKAEVASGTPAPDLDAPEGYPGVYGDRRRTCGWQLYDAVGVEKGDRTGSAKQMLRNYDLFDAPHVAIVTSPRALGPYGAMDTGGFVTAFTLAARACGVDTIPQAAVAFYAEFVRSHFGIADDRMVLCAISFGYADPHHPANSFRTDRAALADIVDWQT
ncbi:nitroreductase [uncultured Roseobacter sp.]|uniref:nitroreductase n=1 Tax=uncultured Roseobacter sp. TaxID=114847 RepID=UPI002621BEF2|nr:nitroreductase [uncultured Roseobacter sp.]